MCRVITYPSTNTSSEIAVKRHSGEMMQIKCIKSAGRQIALSADRSDSSENAVSAAYGVMATQLIGAYRVIPALVPQGDGTTFRYGVQDDMARVMAERAVAEHRARNDSLPPDIQHAKIQKLVKGRKQASQKVRLVFTNLIPFDPSAEWFSGTKRGKTIACWNDYEASRENEYGGMVHNTIFDLNDLQQYHFRQTMAPFVIILHNQTQSLNF